ncbi:MAG: DUF885 domain-containing protein [Steroidobacteraceae bacterium]
MRIAFAGGLLGCFSLLALTGCATAPGTATPPAAAADPARIEAESRRINEWFDAKFEEQLRFSPMGLTYLGRKELYDQLDDFSLEEAEKELAWQKASVEEMRARFDYSLLSPEARRSYDVWQDQYERAAAGAPYRLHGYVFEQMGGAQSELPTFLISFHEVATESDALAWISRASQIPRALDQLLTRAYEAAKLGIRPPRFAYEGAIDQSQKVISGAPFDGGADSPLWADLQSDVGALVDKGVISAARAEQIKAQGRAVLADQVGPAYRRLISWLQSDMANAAVNPTGVGSTLPDGAAYYRNRLSAMTTTPLTAEQIHQTGLREVKRLRAEMQALKSRTGFKGSLDDFFKFIDSDPRFRYPNTDAGRQAYLDDATAAINNIKKELPHYFGLLPKADLVVRRVEAFRERDGGAQHYYSGTPDGSRPGVYYAHLSDMNAMPKTELEVIAYHEGLPGHHMQLSIAQEIQGIPKFRGQARYTAYAEGWGLYAEWLAKEMPNTYQDPYSDFGRLTSEMWRAVRLVVDTGLHAKGWTEEQAVEYFDANTSIPITAVRSEIRRYLVMPGQATAYKIGMLKIQELRARAERKLGRRFDIRAFHDVVLKGGALPLDILERSVDEWIAQQLAAS